MASDPHDPTSVINEPLRLLLSPQEQAFIETRIAKARKQLLWGIMLPTAYIGSLYLWSAYLDQFADLQRMVSLFFVLGFFIVFGVTFHLLLAGSVDWVMFMRYRRNHRAFLNRYNRT